MPPFRAASNKKYRSGMYLACLKTSVGDRRTGRAHSYFLLSEEIASVIIIHHNIRVAFSEGTNLERTTIIIIIIIHSRQG